MKAEKSYYTILSKQCIMICTIMLSLLALACNDIPDSITTVDEWPQIYPNYINATIPADMTPLNFSIKDHDVTQIDVKVNGSAGGQMHSSGRHTDFDKMEWKKIVEKNAGRELVFSVCAKRKGQWIKYRDFQVNIR